MPRLASAFGLDPGDTLPWPSSHGATALLELRRPRCATFFDDAAEGSAPAGHSAVEKVLQLNQRVVNVTGRLHEAQLKERAREGEEIREEKS